MKHPTGTQGHSRRLVRTNEGKQQGKRHRYDPDSETRNLVQSARSIGFSHSEISELERLYRFTLKRDRP